MLSRVEAAEGPILIAFDGSDAAQRAVSDAARLLGARKALVVTVWESGLAYAMQDVRPDGMILSPAVDPEVAMNVDREVRSHAGRVANEGAALARSLGLDAEPLAVPDDRDVPDDDPESGARTPRRRDRRRVARAERLARKIGRKHDQESPQARQLPGDRRARAPRGSLNQDGCDGTGRHPYRRRVSVGSCTTQQSPACPTVPTT